MQTLKLFLYICWRKTCTFPTCIWPN